MSITVTPDLLSTPPRNIVQVSSGVGSVMQTVSLSRTDHDGTALVRTQPVAGFESRTIDDFFCPYEEGVTYSWQATFLAPAANVFAETWASLAAWTTSGGSWSVSGGRVIWSVADSVTASVVRAVSSGRYRALFSVVPVGLSKIDFGGFYIDVLNNRLVLGAASQAFVPGATTWTLDVTPTSVTIVTSAGSYSVAGTALVTTVSFIGPVATYAFGASFGSAGSGNGQFSSPAGAATDSSGNVYVADTGNNRVQKFNSSGVYQSQFGSAGSGNGQFSQAGALAIDSTGNIWVVDTGNNRVQKFNSSGAYQSQFGTAGTGNGQFNTPIAIAIDASSNLFVVDANNYRVQKFNSSGVYQSQFGSSSVFLAPCGIAIDASGNLWVADAGANHVLKFNSAGVFQSQFTATGARSIAIDTVGNLFVGHISGAYRVQKYSQAGDLLQAIAAYSSSAGGAFQPSGIAIGSSGELWVADQQPRLQRFVRTATSIPPVTLTTYGTLSSISETSAVVTLDYHGAYLIHPQSPGKSFRLQNIDPRVAGIRTFGDVGNPTNSNLHYIAGSKTPVQSNNGARQDDILSVTIATVSSAERVAMRAVLEDDLPLLIQVAPSWGSDFNCGWYSVGDPTERRQVQWLTLRQSSRLFDASVTKVQPPVVDVENSGWSWAQLASEFASWDAVMAVFATWDDLAANNRS